MANGGQSTGRSSGLVVPNLASDTLSDIVWGM